MKLFEEIASLESKGQAAALCTVVRAEGSTPRRAGSKMLVYPDGRTSGTIGGGDMESRVVVEAQAALMDGKTRILAYKFDDPQRGDPGVCGGQIEVFVEPLLAPMTVVVVGLGHVGKAVVELAHWLGWRVTAADDRPEFCTPEYVPDADEYLSGALGDLSEKLRIHEQTYVVLTTRSVDLDVEILPFLLDTSAPYIGVIGSRRRWETTRKQLIQQGVPTDKVERVLSPIGMDIGAETPAEIALSVTAEIILTRRGGAVGKMKRDV